jgi:acetyl-CoA carboxylase biotin carboxylase subunit
LPFLTFETPLVPAFVELNHVDLEENRHRWVYLCAMTVNRVLVANRGEIAVRIVKACRALGVEAVVAVSEADRETLAAKLADRVVCIGPPRSADSYLSVKAIISAARGSGCDAVHPGYGFLAK